MYQSSPAVSLPPSPRVKAPALTFFENKLANAPLDTWKSYLLLNYFSDRSLSKTGISSMSSLYKIKFLAFTDESFAETKPQFGRVKLPGID